MISNVSVVEKGGQMKVLGPSAKGEEFLKIMQLYRVFPEFPSAEDAWGSFPESARSIPEDHCVENLPVKGEKRLGASPNRFPGCVLEVVLKY
jgi:hypothetical protein